METGNIATILGSLGEVNASIRAAESHAAVGEAAGAAWLLIDSLAEELIPGETPQRFGPLIYSLRSIYGQIEQTRAMVDVPQFVDWSDAVLARISRELSQPAESGAALPEALPAGELYPMAATASTPIPDGAREFVIFESVARPGYRIACYHMGAADELFGLDGKPRVPPDPTKWGVVAYIKLPEGLDLIPPSAMALPGDDGSPDWNAEPPAPARSATELTPKPAEPDPGEVFGQPAPPAAGELPVGEAQVAANARRPRPLRP